MQLYQVKLVFNLICPNLKFFSRSGDGPCHSRVFETNWYQGRFQASRWNSYCQRLSRLVVFDEGGAWHRVDKGSFLFDNRSR